MGTNHCHRRRRIRCRAWIAALGLALSLLPLAAAGQGGPDTGARAKALFSKGEVQYRLGKFRDALGHYEAALKLVRRPSIIYNIAQCHRQLKHLEQALFFYRLYLSDWKREHPGRAQPPNHAELQRHVATLQAEIKARDAARKQQQEAEQKKQLEAARLRKVEALRLKRLEQALIKKGPASAPAVRKRPPPPRPGQLRLVGLTVAQARVLVDNQLRAVVPIQGPISVRAGQHQVVVTAPGYRRWSSAVRVPAGQTVDVVVTLEEQAGVKNFWLVISISSLVLAGGSEAMAVVFANKANEHYRDTPPFEDDRQLSIIGHTLAGVMGAAAVASFIAYLLSMPSSDTPPDASAGVVPLPGGAAAVGTFRF